MNTGNFNLKTLTIQPITKDDIDEALESLESVGYVRESKPVLVNDEYIGTYNSLNAEINLSANISKDTFDKLFKKIPVDKTYFGIADYGKGIDHTFECTCHNEITNIRRIRKGKRYIIKFEYTGLMNFIGKVVK